MRKACFGIVGALCMASLLLGSPLGAQTPADVAKDSCPASAPQAPQPHWLTSSGCYNQSLCMNVDYCWSICPEASSAACVGNVCQFTFPGSSNPPSSSNCPEQRLCNEFSGCTFFDGTIGTCVNNFCVC